METGEKVGLGLMIAGCIGFLGFLVMTCGLDGARAKHCEECAEVCQASEEKDLPPADPRVRTDALVNRLLAEGQVIWADKERERPDECFVYAIAPAEHCMRERKSCDMWTVLALPCDRVTFSPAAEQPPHPQPIGP
jgi:hypothetical protein